MSAKDLITAIDSGDVETVRTLLDASPEAASRRDPDGLPLVLRALYRRRARVAEVIAERHGNLDLHEAAALGRYGRAEEVLRSDHGSVDHFSADGFTPLHYAAYFGHPDLARLLLDHGADADVEARNPSRVRPLHSAAARGDVTICRMLLDAGADPDRRQEGGFTPLMSAALHGRTELVEELLSRGADPAVAAEDGRSAADFAREGDHAALASRVEEAAGSGGS